MNKIILSGNLGHSATVRDVEKADHSGTTPVVNFSLAVRMGYGEREETLWVGCSWWGDRAAKVAQWLTKGRRVLVTGSAGVRTWAKRDGTGATGAELAVRVDDLELLDSAREESAPRAGTAPADTAAKSAAEKVDDDVPF